MHKLNLIPQINYERPSERWESLITLAHLLIGPKWPKSAQKGSENCHSQLWATWSRGMGLNLYICSPIYSLAPDISSSLLSSKYEYSNGFYPDPHHAMCMRWSQFNSVSDCKLLTRGTHGFILVHKNFKLSALNFMLSNSI